MLSFGCFIAVSDVFTGREAWLANSGVAIVAFSFAKCALYTQGEQYRLGSSTLLSRGSVPNGSQVCGHCGLAENAR